MKVLFLHGWHSVPGEEHLQAHVMIQAPNEARLKVLKEAAETMRLAKPKAAPPR